MLRWRRDIRLACCLRRFPLLPGPENAAIVVLMGRPYNSSGSKPIALTVSESPGLLRLLR